MNRLKLKAMDQNSDNAKLCSHFLKNTMGYIYSTGHLAYFLKAHNSKNLNQNQLKLST